MGRFWLVSLVLVLLAGSSAAQPVQLYAVDIAAAPSFPAAGGLSPDLALAAALGVDFQGTTRGGKPVLAFAPGTTPRQAQDMIDATGAFRVTVLGPPGLHDEIRNLVLRMDGNSQPQVVQGLRTIEALPRMQLYVLETESRRVSAASLQALQGMPGLLRASPDNLVRLLSTPDDPDWLGLGWADGQTGLRSIHAEKAWTALTGDGSVTVAVIDTGIDIDGDDFVDNFWMNPDEIDGNGVDDDGNGFVDDVKGWDFMPTGGSYDGTDNPDDKTGHGTAVAGIIGARGNNGVRTAGVCWDVRLMALRIFTEASPKDIFAPQSRIAKAIWYAREEGALVANCSWGGSGFLPEIFYEMQSASDVLFVCAAGNDGKDNDITPVYPASFALGNVVAVANAYDGGAGLHGNSNHGDSSVHLAAPGVWVETPALDDLHGKVTGTSAAAPFVAGAAALMLMSECWDGLRGKDLRDALLQNALGLSDLSGDVMEHPSTGVSGGTFLDLAFLEACPDETGIDAMADDGGTTEPGEEGGETSGEPGEEPGEDGGGSSGETGEEPGETSGEDGGGTSGETGEEPGETSGEDGSETTTEEPPADDGDPTTETAILVGTSIIEVLGKEYKLLHRRHDSLHAARALVGSPVWLRGQWVNGSYVVVALRGPLRLAEDDDDDDDDDTE